ncbi:MAG TPA: AAA family ATPase, partial [Dehalococcoidia bacterium]|nr:AAA family ATPase [Dehalococcoidia bacterium]
KDYRYSHNYEGHFSGQANLPEEIANKKFYQPSDQGYEEVIRKRLASWWENRSPNET